MASVSITKVEPLPPWHDGEAVFIYLKAPKKYMQYVDVYLCVNNKRYLIGMAFFDNQQETYTEASIVGDAWNAIKDGATFYICAGGSKVELKQPKPKYETKEHMELAVFLVKNTSCPTANCIYNCKGETIGSEPVGNASVEVVACGKEYYAVPSKNSYIISQLPLSPDCKYTVKINYGGTSYTFDYTYDELMKHIVSCPYDGKYIELRYKLVEKTMEKTATKEESKKEQIVSGIALGTIALLLLLYHSHQASSLAM